MCSFNIVFDNGDSFNLLFASWDPDSCNMKEQKLSSHRDGRSPTDSEPFAESQQC